MEMVKSNGAEKTGPPLFRMLYVAFYQTMEAMTRLQIAYPLLSGAVKIVLLDYFANGVCEGLIDLDARNCLGLDKKADRVAALGCEVQHKAPVKEIRENPEDSKDKAHNDRDCVISIGEHQAYAEDK